MKNFFYRFSMFLRRDYCILTKLYIQMNNTLLYLHDLQIKDTVLLIAVCREVGITDNTSLEYSMILEEAFELRTSLITAW